MKENLETIDEIVRDFTSVVPRSKSEVRKRIEELLAEKRAELAEKIKELMDETMGGLCSKHQRYDNECIICVHTLIGVGDVLALLLPNEEGK